MSQPTKSANSAAKHRACDECRSRKLACSKDPDGCERCTRENIRCHYSEQKPMGRPRKRQYIESSAANQVVDDQIPDQDQDLGLLPFFIDYNDTTYTDLYFTTGQPLVPTASEAAEPTHSNTDSGVVWHFGDREILRGQPINFGEIDFENGKFGPAEDEVPPFNQTPHLTIDSSPALTDSEHSSPKSGTCSCLASMYLALASLQAFPLDIKSALFTVRSAAETAQKCLWCTQCGVVLFTDVRPPIEAFQNTMLLGTIIPIIVNGYGRVLKMIDDETDAATAAGQTKRFRLQDYGGLSCELANSMSCSDKAGQYNDMEMTPTEWRTAIRALLRIDLYGHDQSGFKHRGLKDLVTDMEKRQTARHQIIDAHVAAGIIPNILPGIIPGMDLQCLRENSTEKADCLRMVKMARIAIDSLIIA